MSTVLEFECRVPVDGYRIMVFDEPKMRIVPDLGPELIDYGLELGVRMILEPQSEKIRRFDLFKEASSPFLEFVNTPLKRGDFEAAKVLADRFGPLIGGGPQYADQWIHAAQELRRAVTKWEKAKETGDFSSIIQFVSRQGRLEQKYGRIFESDVGRIDANILLREQPVDGAALLCIRPTTLLNALWTQLALAINGSQSLQTCVECSLWFAIEADRGRSDKEYCSDACRMRAYRKRKGERLATGAKQRRPRSHR